MPTLGALRAVSSSFCTRARPRSTDCSNHPSGRRLTASAPPLPNPNHSCYAHRRPNHSVLPLPHRWSLPPLRFDKLLEHAHVLIEPFRAECAAALAKLNATQTALAEAESLVRRATLVGQRAAYASECNFLLTASRPEQEPADYPAGGSLALGALLSNAPTLRDYLQLLGSVRLPTEQQAEVRNTLCSYLRGVQWAAAASAAQSDVEVLLQLAAAQPGLVDADVVASALKNKTFAAPLDSLTLSLLVHCHRHAEVRGGKGQANENVEDGKEGVVASPKAAPALADDAADEEAEGGFPLHGPAAVAIVAWLGRLTPPAWTELPAWTSGEASSVLNAAPAAEILQWVAQLVSLHELCHDEHAAAVWVIELLLRSLEDAQRGTDIIATLGTLLVAPHAPSEGLHRIEGVPLPTVCTEVLSDACPCVFLAGVLLRLVLASCRRSAQIHPATTFELLMDQLKAQMAEETAASPQNEEEEQPSMAGAPPPSSDSRLLPVAGELLAFTLDTICPLGLVTMEALMATPRMWTDFFSWHAVLVSAQVPVSQPPECGEYEDTLAALASMAKSARRAVAAGAELGSCPMGSATLTASKVISSSHSSLPARLPSRACLASLGRAAHLTQMRMRHSTATRFLPFQLCPSCAAQGSRSIKTAFRAWSRSSPRRARLFRRRSLLTPSRRSQPLACGCETYGGSLWSCSMIQRYCAAAPSSREAGTPTAWTTHRPSSASSRRVGRTVG